MRNSKKPDQLIGPPPSDPIDRRLIKAVADGDRAAITELYEVYFPRLFRFMYRLSRDYQLTEEVANDVMLIVWKNAGQFRGSSKVSTWILGIGYRQCMKRLRKRRIPALRQPVTPEIRFDNHDSVELDDSITKALRELSPDHRMMIECVLYLGMSYKEVAEMADCPVNTAKTRVHNARKKLRVILTAMGYRYGEDIE